uniref:CCHC-type domain-containing protein n=1 Tax=Chelonoidis abingdonii TaxID=106734 RepID=A0A8C0FYL3_CHEAB
MSSSHILSGPWATSSGRSFGGMVETDGRAGTRRPAAEHRTCYACLRQGHIKKDCPYWVGSRLPQPEKGHWQVPRAVCRVRELRQLPVCWTCRQTGHFWRDCPGPGNMARFCGSSNSAAVSMFSCLQRLQLNIEAAAKLLKPWKYACRPKGT